MSITKLSKSLLHRLSDEATEQTRRRQNFNLHRHYSDPCQRFLNAVGVDSYIQPHRHALDPKRECLICVRGRAGLLLFDALGHVTDTFEFGAAYPNLGIGAEVDPHEWHTVVALEPGTVLLEIKAGPFDPSAAKELGVWAPAEGSPEASSYLANLKRHFDTQSNTAR